MQEGESKRGLKILNTLFVQGYPAISYVYKAGFLSRTYQTIHFLLNGHNEIDTDVGLLSWKWKFSSYSEGYQSSESAVISASAVSPCTPTRDWVVHEKGDSVTNINETKQ